MSGVFSPSDREKVTSGQQKWRFPKTTREKWRFGIPIETSLVIHRFDAEKEGNWTGSHHNRPRQLPSPT
jgi:hypothetical protein